MNDDYTEQATMLLTYAYIIANAPIDLEKLVRTASYADGVGPILYPSEYIHSTGDYRLVAELARLLLPFQKRSQAIIEERANP